MNEPTQFGSAMYDRPRRRPDEPAVPTVTHDADDRCLACREHIADPHAPGCPLDDDLAAVRDALAVGDDLDAVGEVLARADDLAAVGQALVRDDGLAAVREALAGEGDRCLACWERVVDAHAQGCPLDEDAAVPPGGELAVVRDALARDGIEVVVSAQNGWTSVRVVRSSSPEPATDAAVLGAFLAVTPYVRVTL